MDRHAKSPRREHARGACACLAPDVPGERCSAVTCWHAGPVRGRPGPRRVVWDCSARPDGLGVFRAPDGQEGRVGWECCRAERSGRAGGTGRPQWRGFAPPTMISGVMSYRGARPLCWASVLCVIRGRASRACWFCLRASAGCTRVSAEDSGKSGCLLPQEKLLASQRESAYNLWGGTARYSAPERGQSSLEQRSLGDLRSPTTPDSGRFLGADSIRRDSTPDGDTPANTPDSPACHISARWGVLSSPIEQPSRPARNPPRPARSSGMPSTVRELAGRTGMKPINPGPPGPKPWQAQSDRFFHRWGRRSASESAESSPFRGFIHARDNLYRALTHASG
jgi:hypothetical protein